MLTVVRALWLREITKFLRDRSRLVGALVQPLGFWVLLGLGFYGTFQMPGTAPGASEVGYLEYLYPGIIALILLFTAIFSTISVVQERQEGFLQAALVAPVPRTTIVLGLVSGGTTLAVAEAALFLLLAPLLGVRVDLAEPTCHAIEHVRLQAALAESRHEHVRVIEYQALRHSLLH